MFSNKKFIITAVLFVCCLFICTMAANYIFIQDTKTDISGTVDVKERSYVVNNIVLTAGNSDASCEVKDFNGNDISENQEGIKNFFVENEDVTDGYGNHFVQLKKYYINMSQDDSTGVMTYKLSNKKEDDTYFVCPYFYDKDGNEIDYAYYGKYKAYVDGKMCSKNGASPTFGKSVNTYRTYARANGDQYHQTDWCAVFTAQIMFMCAYKTTDISKALTYRTSGSETGKGTEILGIEDLVGNGYEAVDGVVFRTDGSGSLAGSSVSYADKISDYASGITTNQTTLTGATGSSGNYISKMYYSDDQPALSLFPKEINGSSSTYYCDRFYYSSSNQANSTYWGANGSVDGYGLFYLSCNRTWSNTSSNIGSRLHTKKLYKTITLEAGYEDKTCYVADFNGNELSQDYVKSFFVENEDVVDSYDNHFVKLNKYYINMSQDDSTGVITYKLSNKKEDDTYFVCPYFYDKDGNETDYAYYGKYKAYVVDGKMCSKNGVLPTFGQSVSNYRTYARANGDQYHQTDWCAVFTSQIMLMCTYKTTNISEIITYRSSNGSQTGDGTQILGIEDIIGNGFEYLDGLAVNFKSSLDECSVSWADKISDYGTSYAEINEATLTGAVGSSGGYVSKMYYSSGKSALSIFPKELNGTSSTYYCSRIGYSTGSGNSIYWGASSIYSYTGLFGMDSYSSGLYSKGAVGSRLHAKIMAL